MKQHSPPSEPSNFGRWATESGLTHSQLQIWTGQKVHPQSAFCNMAFAIVLEGAVDVAALQAAWRRVASESDVLRTCVVEVNGAPVRRELDADALPAEFHDFSKHHDPVAEFKRWAKSRCATLLPLDRALVDCALVKLTDSSYGWYLNQHHLVTDATSTVLLFQVVSATYQALISRQSELPPVPSGYYKVTQAAFEESQAASRAAGSHWAGKTAGAQRRVRIYGKEGDPARTKSSRLEYELTEEESRGIREVSEAPEFQSMFPDVSRYTVFATLLAGWLYRVSGQTAVSFDSPAGNRPTRASKRSLGCFIEMFPLDVELSEGDTFRSLGARCMEEVRGFLANVAPGARAPDRATASNIVLNYFARSFGTFANHPIHAEWIHSGHIDGVCDLKLQVHDYNGTGRYVVQFDVSDQAFSAYDKERLVHHFRRILNAMLSNLDTRIAAVDMLSPAERERTLVSYNSTDLNPIPESTVLQRIEKQASAHPDAIAIRDGSAALTYADLWTSTERIASALRRMGAAPDACVAVLMARSIDLVLVLLGILRAGAAYVPIDRSYPAKRVTHIISNSGAKLVITGGAAGEVEAKDSVRFVSAASLLSTPAHEKVDRCPPQPSDLAYVIYTSGSTGQPKGVEIEHAGLIDYLVWAERRYLRGNRLTFPLFTSLAFDLTVTSLFLPLMTGGQLIVYPQRDRELDSAVIDVIQDNAVDFIKLTPSHLSLLKQVDLSQSRLSRIVVGGEDLKRSLAQAIVSQFSHPVEIFNEYGPTECVVGCMIHLFDPGEKERAGPSVPIGIPADHVKLYLLNEDHLPVPEGTPGELYIARNGLARGYRNDPDKTEGSFIANPFGGTDRLYRTGDLARFSAEGIMTFLGRVDSQVKIAGHRVELGEIEAALLREPRVRNAFVTTRVFGDINKSPRLAYCRECGLASDYPGIVFSEDGLCSICHSFRSIRQEASAYFKTPDALRAIFEASRRAKSPPYDCMMFFSGGKDSTYALCQLVDLGLRVYAFTLDNGYLSSQAMANIRRVAQALGVDHEFATTPAMNEIFRDSLARFSNVCNGCFKTIYTLGINRAHELGIPIIVTGLSRGQFFETRLTADLFRDGKFRPEDVDAAVVEARKRYHRTSDAVSRCLNVRLVQRDATFEEIQFIDFFRYWNASLEEIYSYLARRVPWMRPSDTGRSTNCRVNDVGIYIHQKERGFHNYALPYSWDVRLGQKQRSEALKELEDRIDLKEVRQMLRQIGYDENRLTSEARTELVAYYESEEDLDTANIARHLDQWLPPQMQPRHFVRVDRMPLTSHGKIDTRALPAPRDASQDPPSMEETPRTPVEQHVALLWTRTLRRQSVGLHESFFQLGGGSLNAMEITLQLCRDFAIDLPLQAIFKLPTVAQVSAEIERLILQQIERMSDEDAARLLQEPSNR
ncbi:MAG: amino acid adenylation domain-containing protein [Verrucomicrobiia bacterium]